MTNSTDPSAHQAAEREMIEHVTRLLDDPRLVVDTTTGRRPVTALVRDVSRADRGVELKRQMTELKVPDRALQERMPVGEQIDVTLSTKRFFIFKKAVGSLRVMCVSPTRALLRGEASRPMTSGEVEQLLRQTPPPVSSSRVPMTLVLVSTSGFEMDSRESVERTAHRTVLLAEPNDAGGWTVHGPVETKALVDLFDPEQDERKRDRVRAEIDAAKVELLGGSGIASDKLATKLQLPLQFVEATVKSYAKDNPGLAAKRLDGRVVLFREGTTPALGGASAGRSATTSSAAADAGGSDMPLFDRIKSLFSRKGETEKKVAFLSERRAALSQQRDRAYEEINALEHKDNELRDEFKKARAPLTKRRITGQLLQLQKDIARRQQMVQVLNQQVNVVSTHLHNLELAQQGQVAQLPDSEEIASDAAAAEEMLAQLQADNELADSVGSPAATAGMSAEEQALFEELEREASGGGTGATATGGAVERSEPADRTPAPPARERTSSPARASDSSNKRAEPEAG